MLTFSSFLSSIASGMTRLRMLRSERLSKSYMLKNFLREKRISKNLSTRIIRHVDLAQKAEGSSVPVEKVTLLSYLTSAMHVELQKELVAPWLSSHPFFYKYMKLSDAAVHALCTVALKQLRYAKDDIIFQQGSEATHMYFAVSGLLRYKFCRKAPEQSQVT